ncbi:TPA: hypothetical protein ACIUHN_004045 [Salmonella enterica subsp. diarizonae serovar 50:k:z35]
MSDFKPLGSLSQSDTVNTLYFDENASAATLLNTVIGRLEGVMRLHDEIAMLPPDAGIDGKALSTVSKTLLSDAYSLLLAVQSHAEKYGDARELIKQHAITYSALAGLIRKQNQPQEEEGRV